MRVFIPPSPPRNSRAYWITVGPLFLSSPLLSVFSFVIWRVLACAHAWACRNFKEDARLAMGIAAPGDKRHVAARLSSRRFLFFLFFLPKLQKQHFPSSCSQFVVAVKFHGCPDRFCDAFFPSSNQRRRCGVSFKPEPSGLDIQMPEDFHSVEPGRCFFRRPGLKKRQGAICP